MDEFFKIKGRSIFFLRSQRDQQQKTDLRPSRFSHDVVDDFLSLGKKEEARISCALEIKQVKKLVD
ncbi:MAG: hypothetical protein KKD63_06715 [Proteobacteria bacterium]|nr:hypothetical protein [Desulfobulbaceae bacterium]MBU4152554.1 hypothetical protein [Pseudomonadota bacterium]MDP2105324.1 hypothetical protein [Desulfobulbaceae bacterium]